MSGPSIFKKGKLIETYNEKQEELDKIVPLNYVMDWFNDRIKKTPEDATDRVLLLHATTGSGKSAVVPPEIYHRFYEKMGSRDIVSAQPKVLTALSIPRDSIIPFNTREFLDSVGLYSRKPLVLGENIGYQTGGGGELKPRDGGILFVTAGTLEQQLNTMSDEAFMDKYSVIVYDEAHERSLQADLLLFLLKKFYTRNSTNIKCPFLIITSATFDPIKYASYFLSAIPEEKRLKNIIKIEGYNFPIHEHFEKVDVKNYANRCVEIVKAIHKGEDENLLPEDNPMIDILIFFAGGFMINMVYSKIMKLNMEDEFFKKNPIYPIRLMGMAIKNKTKEYLDIMEPLDSILFDVKISKKKTKKVKPTRRVILSTEVAETGITFPTLGYVIEPGFHNSASFDPIYNVNSLIEKPVSQNSHRQRKGRVGRRDKGVCYSLFREEVYNMFQVDDFADLLRQDVADVILSVIIKTSDDENILNELTPYEAIEKNIISKFNSINLFDVDLLDKFSADSIHNSIERLYILGAIDHRTIPTNLGIIMNKFRKISLESVKMILSGFAWNVSILDLITIAAFLEVRSDKLIADSSVFRKQKAADLFNYLGFEEKDELIISCDFIKFIIVFAEVQKILSQKKLEKEMENPIKKLENFLQNAGLSSAVLSDVIVYRDEYISTLYDLGFDPTINEWNSYHTTYGMDMQYKLDWIKGIKQCIYEGYKYNLAQWNTVRNDYYTKRDNIALNLTRKWISDRHEINIYGDNNPKFIVFSSISYRYDPKKDIYMPNVVAVSSMDGYVAVDSNFESIYNYE